MQETKNITANEHANKRAKLLWPCIPSCNKRMVINSILTIRHNVPKNPNSSPATEKMKSVCASGKLFFNELFNNFFKDTDKKIGFCFPGHEVFYEKYVDILVTLDGFVDTRKAYKNNEETELLLNNFKNINGE